MFGNTMFDCLANRFASGNGTGSMETVLSVIDSGFGDGFGTGLVFAQAERTVFQWGRINEPGDCLIPALVAVAVALVAVWMYRKQNQELPVFFRYLLPGLRFTAIGLILLLYFQPQWRNEKEVTVPSRVVVCVDSSLSMAITDETGEMEETGETGETRGIEGTGKTDDTGMAKSPGKSGDFAVSRWDRVKGTLGIPELLDSWREQNDVQLLTVDSRIRELGYYPKKGGLTNGGMKVESEEAGSTESTETSRRDVPASLGRPLGLANALGAVSARGQQSRLSDCLADWLRSSGGGPISALVLLSDGAQNLGVDAAAGARSAAAEGVVVHTVGLGQTEAPRNIRVYSVQAPIRVQPEDPFAVTALLEGQSVAGENFVVELSVADEKDESATGPAVSPAGISGITPENKPGIGDSGQAILTPEPLGTVLETRTVRIGGTGTGSGTVSKSGVEGAKDGAMGGNFQTVKFEVPAQPVGKKKYQVRIRPSGKESDLSDNAGSAVVESVDRKLQILLLASGPTREYQFLRSLLARDKSIEVDILLQSGKPGMSQEGRKVLDSFPASASGLYAYDGLVAFDPDWNQLTVDQIGWIEKWVGDKSGGLLFVAGPIYLGAPIRNWLENDSCRKLKSLLPVEFERRFSGIGSSRRTGTEPFPLSFSSEGREADFLRLGETDSDSQERWNEFSGVYSYFPVERVKEGATVYAYFSDPQSQGPNGQPPFLAEHFYGSGRVFYVGSGEFWRLRAFDPNWFDRLYTQIVRRVTQGRLARQNDRGTFLPRQDRYYLGDTMEFRAQLTDSQGDPLKVAQLTAGIQAGTGTGSGTGSESVLTLKADPARAGSYTGYASALREGVQTARLTIPQSDVTLQCAVRVELSDLERRQPQRDEQFLKTWAETTGGRYFSRLEDWKTAVLNPAERAAFFPDRSATTIVQESVDREWDEFLMRWFVGLVVAMLSLEWLIRRALKLA